VDQDLDNVHPQHHRQRPQFTHLQRRDLLVRPHKALQSFRVNVGCVGLHGIVGNGVHARVAGKRPRGELRQFVVEGGRHVLDDPAQVALHNVKIVEQPLGHVGGGQHLLLRFADKGGMGLAQKARLSLVLGQEERLGCGYSDLAIVMRQSTGAHFHTFAWMSG
jgi:hypothetical protein